MTTTGNGIWTVTTNMTVGEFKFIFTKGSWDNDYNYGGAAGIITEGGNNIAITAAGNYTIKLDEFNRTYTVTKN